ncbi:hypothetical protein [Pandoraea oxalativorans]|nr:hypothetical protein [Pandoraea oxalativorans]
MARLPPITLRGYARTPLLSSRRRGVLAAALTARSFDSEQAMHDARVRITRMGPLSSFIDCVFHKGEKARSLHALVTLYFYKCAEEIGANPALIRADRDAARKTLATCLSPTAQDALRQSFDVGVGENDFEKYITLEDRHGMVGDMFMNEWRDQRFVAQMEQDQVLRDLAGATLTQIYRWTEATDTAADEAFRLGEAAYRRANLPGNAQAACVDAAADARAAAEAYAKENLHERAAGAWRRVVHAHMRAQQIVEAADASRSAAKALRRVALAHLKAGRRQAAKEAFKRIRQDFERAVQAYTTAGVAAQAQLAAREAEAAAYLEKLAGYPAALAFERAAREYRQLGMAGDAAQADEMAAACYVLLGEYERAAKAYARAGKGEKAAKNWARAAHGYAMQEGMHEQAENAFEMAALGFEAIRQHEQAVLAWVHAGRADEAIKVYVRAGMGELAAYERAARACLQIGEHVQAGKIWAELADLYLGRALFAEAATGYEHVAGAYLAEHKPTRAADALLIAAALFIKAAEHAVDARRAAQWRERAAQDFESAAELYTTAGESATDVHEAAQWHERAAQAFRQAGLLMRAVHAYMRAGLTEQAAYARIGDAHMQERRYAPAVDA